MADGRTPLFVACWKGQIDAVRLLLDNGADVDRARDNGKTPLFIACVMGRLDAARVLLDKGAEVDRADKNGRTPLYAACEKGHVDAARLLLDNGAEVDRADEDGATPLCIVCYYGHVDAARLLLDNGADVNWAREDGRTPLFIAAGVMGRLDAAQLLLEKGAEVDKADQWGKTPLFVACGKNDVEVVRLLLENGAEVNRAMKDGATPLLAACETGCVGAAHLLLDKGAEVNRAVSKGWEKGRTPLWIACSKGHVDAARLLLDKGAEVDRADMLYGKTPLRIACQNGHVAVVRMLLDKGAEVDRADKEGATPLLIACEKGRVDAARLLLDKGAEVDRTKENGVTPLLIACQFGHVDAARLLLDKGAVVDRVTPKGRTPLSIAKEEGHSSILALLLERLYADPRLKVGAKVRCWFLDAASNGRGDDGWLDGSVTSLDHDRFRVKWSDEMADVLRLRTSWRLEDATELLDAASAEALEDGPDLDEAPPAHVADPAAEEVAALTRSLEAKTSECKRVSAELARVQGQVEASSPYVILRLEQELGAVDVWEQNNRVGGSDGKIVFGIGPTRNKSQTVKLTDATLDPKLRSLLDMVLLVGRLMIEPSELEKIQTIYVINNGRARPHTDPRNLGLSHLINIGNHVDATKPSAGALWTQTEGIKNTYYRMISFQAQDTHAVMPYDGTRYSLCYFRTFLVVDESLRAQMNEYGFALAPSVKLEELKDHCHICGKSTKGSHTLLCDGNNRNCTAEVHSSCLERLVGPNFNPKDDWFCSFCAKPRQAPTSDDESVQLDHAAHAVNLDENFNGAGRLTDEGLERAEEEFANAQKIIDVASQVTIKREQPDDTPPPKRRRTRKKRK